MKTKLITVAFNTSRGNEYVFRNICSGTTEGFRHETNMVGSNGITGLSASDYLNRTWEKYEFQSVMCRCVHQEMDYLRNDALAQAKQELGLERATDKVRKLQEEILSKSERFADLEELYSLIYNRK